MPVVKPILKTHKFPVGMFFLKPKLVICTYKFFKYHKIASSNTSRLEAHVGFFRLLMKGIFGPYVL